MIKVKELNQKMMTITANLKGVRLIEKSLTDIELEKQIKDDITSNLEDINKLNVYCEIEDYSDARTFKSCSIIRIEMLVQLKKFINEGSIELIKKYLENSLVSHIY